MEVIIMALQTSQNKSYLEFARVIVLAIVAYLLTDGVLGTILALFAVYLNPASQLIIMGLTLSILKAVDKYLHLEAEPKTGFLQEKGLTNF